MKNLYKSNEMLIKVCDLKACLLLRKNDISKSEFDIFQRYKRQIEFKLLNIRLNPSVYLENPEINTYLNELNDSLSKSELLIESLRFQRPRRRYFFCHLLKFRPAFFIQI